MADSQFKLFCRFLQGCNALQHKKACRTHRTNLWLEITANSNEIMAKESYDDEGAIALKVVLPEWERQWDCTGKTVFSETIKTVCPWAVFLWIGGGETVRKILVEVQSVRTAAQGKKAISGISDIPPQSFFPDPSFGAVS